MALKNLFDMVKADRYTADGREALIKAQEAETEDATRRTYQIGEISQATGLQKTANGWVKPKSGKKPGAKKEEPKNVHGAEVDKIYERQLKRIKELKAKGFTDEQIDNDKIIKQTKEDMKNVGKKTAESKPAEGMPGRDFPALKKEDHVKLAKEVLSNTSATDPGWTAEEIAKEWKLGKADAEEVKKEFDNLRKGSSGNKPLAEKRQNANRQRGEQLAQPAEKKQSEGYQHWQGVLTGYRDGSLLEQRKQLQESVDEFEDDLKDYDRRGLASAVYGKRIDQKNWQIGALKAIDEEMERRGMNPAPTESKSGNRIDEYWRKIRKETQPVARMAAELDRGTFDDDVRDTMGDGQSMEDLARSLISPAFEDDGYIPQDKLDTARKFILKRYKALESDATDAAPRVLTGDTRIRVRKA